jgi:hypothetical protein
MIRSRAMNGPVEFATMVQAQLTWLGLCDRVEVNVAGMDVIVGGFKAHTIDGHHWSVEGHKEDGAMQPETAAATVIGDAVGDIVFDHLLEDMRSSG